MRKWVSVMQQYISERICQLRKSKGLTQEKLGSMLGVTSQAVSKWEKGESFPDILILPDLCEILGITADALLGGGYPAAGDAVSAFCEYAARNGANQTLMQAVERLFCDGQQVCGSYLDMGQEHVRYYDPRGMCFVANSSDLFRRWLEGDISRITPLMYLLRSPEWMGVLACFRSDAVMTIPELVEKTGMDEDFVIRAVNEFVTQGFIAAGKDMYGNRGYLLSEGKSFYLFPEENVSGGKESAVSVYIA